MINVSQDVIDEYLTDSTRKEIVIDHKGYDEETLNYYTGDISVDNKWYGYRIFEVGYSKYLTNVVNVSPTSAELLDYMHAPIISDWNYFNVSFYLKVTSVTDASLLSDSIEFQLQIDNHIYGVIHTPKADVLAGVRIVLSNPRTDSLVTDLENATSITSRGWWVGDIASNVRIEYEISQVSVNFTKKAKLPPSIWQAPIDWNGEKARNPYRIDNDTLVYEDFSLTESLCSQDNIKFGLCESAHCEFSEVGANAIKVGDTLNISSTLPNHVNTIPDNDLFAINWVGSTGTGSQTQGSDLYYWIAIVGAAYATDWSDYITSLGLASKKLYYQFNVKFVFNNLTGQKPTYFKFRYYATINGESWSFTSINYFRVSDYDNTFNLLSLTDDMTRNAGVMSGIERVVVRFYDENKVDYAQGVNTGTIITYGTQIQFRIGEPGYTMPAYSQDDLYYAKGTLDAYLSQWGVESIPLGVFKVDSISNEYKHNLIRKKITAYDNLLTLEGNAADWYTQYMYGIDTDDWNSNGFEYARQIYSTYWNYVSSIGLDNVSNYELTTVKNFTDGEFIAYSGNYYKRLTWPGSGGNTWAVCYGASTVNISDPSLLYRVTWDYMPNETENGHKAWFPLYNEKVDSLYRGVLHNAGVLIEEYKSGAQTPYNRICVNEGDFFMLSEETASIKVILPSGNDGTSSYQICKNVVLQSAPPRQTLTNGNLRLCYYNYGTKNIFACESSITGRDVVRSLLEVCGCFFRLDRLHGLPEFVYPTKGGLYPSNTLYPADDLYPRTGTDQLYSMGKYISVIAENYEVKDYGRIQILKDIKSSDTVSVCEWQYEGDPDAENTYIIDDNIFYCADDMEYDYDNMPEVADMLEGMWGVISNLGYVPNITQALGAPGLECGDRIGLLTYDGGFESFVFRRTLKGIQNLRDTYESVGDEKNEAINNFGY